MLTRAELAAIRAILEARYGWTHPLTQRVHRAHEATPPETTTTDDEEGGGSDGLVQGR